ncbi:MAG: ABC transporter substrate-binding protein [Betaproteobacteria bacterium]|nr:ABC transporter substrate-binding protein [Betaproteobacteria bacterium]
MNRRDTVLALLAFSAAPGAVNAQPAPARLALIGEAAALDSADYLALLRDGLRENGLAESKDYILDPFWADGKYERFPALLAAALERKPSIILVQTIAAVRAAQQATKTIPIVFIGTNDPVGSGLVASLARPSGNTTGMATMNDDRAAKLVELVREALPKAKRIAVLINPLNPSNRPIFQAMRSAAVSLGMSAEAFEADSPERIGSAFMALSKMRPDALLTGFDAMLGTQRAQIVSLGLAHKVPVAATNSAYANAGALICFGALRGAILGRVGFYVKRILAGAKPADLPVEQPTQFELVVNLKSAKTLGLAIPRAFLLRADRVIE